jgi:hypothetical protein
LSVQFLGSSDPTEARIEKNKSRQGIAKYKLMGRTAKYKSSGRTAKYKLTDPSSADAARFDVLLLHSSSQVLACCL